MVQENVINNVFGDIVELKCEYCGKNLLEDNGQNAHVLCIKKINKCNEIVDVKCVCKGDCTKNLTNFSDNLSYNFVELHYMMIPGFFFRKYFKILRDINDGYLKFTDKALEKFMLISTALSQKISRKTSEKEMETLLSSKELGTW
ncbi:hypothetical protein IJ541_08760 [bacterium]|nr:hypothetical protein [bacterium]